MSGECCNGKSQVMLLSCSGASNVGQLANQACVELTQEGFGKMFCLAGIGGKLSGFVQSAKDTPEMVVIDGCDVGCAKAIFQENDLALGNYVVLTQAGVEKNKDFDLKRADIDKTKQAVKSICTSTGGAATPGKGGCCCG